jgi:phosphoribosylanthranilate isomerase
MHRLAGGRWARAGDGARGAMTRIKICCMQSAAEVALAVRHGAAAVGFVSAMPSGPGPIPEPLIAELVPLVPPGIASFLLTSRRDAAGIADQVRRLRPSTVQIVDRPEAGCWAALREALPGTTLVQVVHVTGPGALEEALAAAPHVDALLLDSGDPTGAVKQLGGTGRTHDWAVSRRVVAEAGVPVWLAGGLTAANVAAAIAAVRPHGVDVCSGVRTGGLLEEGKLAPFVAAVRAADGG